MRTLEEYTAQRTLAMPKSSDRHFCFRDGGSSPETVALRESFDTLATFETVAGDA